MEEIKVSIIVPVYNAEEFLGESLTCLLQQTMEDFEILCIDDGSTDTSLEILKHYASLDKRIHIFSQENKGAGAARNYGLKHAKGRYCFFFDADDLCVSNLLTETVTVAEQEDADIVAFHFSRFSKEATSEFRVGVHESWLQTNVKTFNYLDCPARIMSIINPTPWNKLFRTSFIREHNFYFEEISSCNDITFSAVTAAAARKIAIVPKALVQYRIGHSNTITGNLTGRLKNIVIAVESAARQVSILQYASQIIDSIYYFVIDNFLFALYNYIVDFSRIDAIEFYNYLHDLFSSEKFTNISREQINNDILYNRFTIVKNYDYHSICLQQKKRLIVSLTSYPRRISSLHKVLETIYVQTRKPDDVILWLSQEQFPHKEEDLSAELQNYINENILTVRWCDDLKPHKKYFYALQEYPDDLIVTIDDDLLYAPTLLERLVECYLMYPTAVIASRTHLITVSLEEKRILPYRYWVQETDACIYQPSLQLLATGGAGTLYPPNLLPKELFNKEVILNTCLWADDLWMKAIELLYEIPVVLACPFAALKYIPASQEEALCKINVDQNRNDVQLNAISLYLESLYGKNILFQKLVCTKVGEYLISTEALCLCLFRERAHNRAKIYEINRKLQKSFSEKSDINAKLKKAYADKSEINAKLQKAYADKSDINAKLKKAYADKSELNRKLQLTYKEKAERGIRIKILEKELDELENSITYKVGCIILFFPKMLYRIYKNFGKLKRGLFNE